MDRSQLLLMAHLMRRIGFGATREELEVCVSDGYEATVEKLLHPSNTTTMPDDIIRRYHTDQYEARNHFAAGASWLYRMITTNNPMEEKIALFWHGLFATGYAKLNQAPSVVNQVDMFRRKGLGRFTDLLVELSKDPAMIIWLDNNDNHKSAINENFGRELLELFSMGVGNYTEDDIKECSRAFTGWTLGNVEYMSVRATKDSIWPYGRIAWHFGYRSEDHDDGEKTFLGEKGRFNGEDIIDLIVRNEATANFICKRIFQFFGSDEIDQHGNLVVEDMVRAYFDSGYEIRSVLRALFNSEYFKSDRSMLARVKGPAEYIVGAIRLAGTYRKPKYEIIGVAQQAWHMGQCLLDPPTVEGWHEGTEWVDSGALVQRVNFVAKELGNTSSPGVRDIANRLAEENQGSVSSREFVSKCLDLIGPIDVKEETLSALSQHVSQRGELRFDTPNRDSEMLGRVAEILSLIAAAPEYQLA